MVSKNNLTSIKPVKRNALPKTDAPTPQKGKVGRKPKDPSLKEDQPTTLKFTKSEMAILKKKAGLAGVSTFLKHYLRVETGLFK